MIRLVCRITIIIGIASAAWAQTRTGELRIDAADQSGQPLSAECTLVNANAEARFEFAAASGHGTVSRIPFGRYHVTIAAPGFAPWSALVEIASENPVRLRAVLSVAPLVTSIVVTDDDTLLDPRRTGAVQHVGGLTLSRRETALPGRDVLALVNLQPGWLVEANGVLHPRGSEYGVQYILDGAPLIDNRSPAFAPPFEGDELESATVRTGGYPAEYGRQLGGVIELSTARDLRRGWHGRVNGAAGSFATRDLSAFAQYSTRRDSLSLTAAASETNRYLDPPVLNNYTNRATGGNAAVRWERDWNGSNRTRASVRRGETRFEVPNEQLQQASGQRQDRFARETNGQLAHTWQLRPETVADFHASVRDLSAALWSNPLSVPVAPHQDRGFRETYTSASISQHHGRHELKAGGDALFRSVRENFGFSITALRYAGVRVFDSDTPRVFQFADRRQNREQSGYVQDLIRLGALTVSAGIRWDHYRLLLDENAWSPRAAVAWQAPVSGLVFRASYDRVFQPPAIENILLSASAAARQLNDAGFALPLGPARGNYYEAGFSKTLLGKARLDASWFRRVFTNYPDVDLLLNTGVSFPIAFSSAEIHGFEAKLDVPRWGRFSGFVSYTNQLGRGQLPLAGGLFLEDNAAAELTSTEHFPISQDQRNSVRTRVRADITRRVWAGAGAQYGSGLPVELIGEPNLPLLAAQYGGAVLARVNFDRGRVRPAFSVDLSAGAELLRRERFKARIQADVMNITDRLNVVNFAGLLSGTAIEAPRWAAVRIGFEF